MPGFLANHWHEWLLLAGLLVAVVVAWRVSPPLGRRAWRFLLATESPLNLGVARVAVFAALQVLLFTAPLRPDSAAAWWPIVIVVTSLATLGVLSRIASLASVVFAGYLLLVPTDTAGVDYTTSLVLLLGAMLACSRCGDAFSLDSLWLAFRRANLGQVERLPRLVRYGLPLRLMMMVLVASFFLPALCSFVQTSGPVVTTPLCVATLIVSLAGPLLLWWKLTRGAWSAAAFVLCAMAQFNSEHGCVVPLLPFVLFVDWQRLGVWLGRRLFRGPLLVLYDGNCRMCRRTMSMLLALDWLQLLQQISAFDRDTIEQYGLGHLEDAALMRDMHAAERGGDREWYTTCGFEAYQRIAWRVPLLWGTLPIVYFPPVAAMGKRVYRHVADNRACSVPIARDPNQPPLLRWTAMPLWLVTVLVLVILMALAVEARKDCGDPLAKCWSPTNLSDLADHSPRRNVSVYIGACELAGSFGSVDAPRRQHLSSIVWVEVAKAAPLVPIPADFAPEVV